MQFLFQLTYWHQGDSAHGQGLTCFDVNAQGHRVGRDYVQSPRSKAQFDSCQQGWTDFVLWAAESQVVQRFIGS